MLLQSAPDCPHRTRQTRRHGRSYLHRLTSPCSPPATSTRTIPSWLFPHLVIVQRNAGDPIRSIHFQRQCENAVAKAYGVYIYRQTVLGDLRISGQKRILRDRDGTIADRLLVRNKAVWPLRTICVPCITARNIAGRAESLRAASEGLPIPQFWRMARRRRSSGVSAGAGGTSAAGVCCVATSGCSRATVRVSSGASSYMLRTFREISSYACSNRISCVLFSTAGAAEAAAAAFSASGSLLTAGGGAKLAAERR